MGIFGKPSDDAGAAWPAITVGLFAAFGGILYGYDTGTIAGIQTMPYWEKQFFPGLNQGVPVTESDGLATSSGKVSLIVSVLSIGTFVGALAAGILADIVGRKWGNYSICRDSIQRRRYTPGRRNIARSFHCRTILCRHGRGTSLSPGYVYTLCPSDSFGS